MNEKFKPPQVLDFIKHNLKGQPELKRNALTEALQAFEQGREVNPQFLPAIYRLDFIKAWENDRVIWENRNKEFFVPKSCYNWITGYKEQSNFFVNRDPRDARIKIYKKKD